MNSGQYSGKYASHVDWIFEQHLAGKNRNEISRELFTMGVKGANGNPVAPGYIGSLIWTRRREIMIERDRLPQETMDEIDGKVFRYRERLLKAARRIKNSNER